MNESYHRRNLRDVEGFLDKHDPFWAPQLVVAAAIGLDLALPKRLTVGPTWLLPSVEALLLLGLVIVSPRKEFRYSQRRRVLALVLIAFVSLVNIVSLVLLCHELLRGAKSTTNGHRLILSGVVLWSTNVLLFGLWFWQLDRGGPIERAGNLDALPDFLFPQMTEPRHAPAGWTPGLVDYLYTSLTNATAFSPTDTMPLTPTAKWLFAVQSLVSLTTLGLIVARAVNILA